MRGPSRDLEDRRHHSHHRRALACVHTARSTERYFSLCIWRTISTCRGSFFTVSSSLFQDSLILPKESYVRPVPPKPVIGYELELESRIGNRNYFIDREAGGVVAKYHCSIISTLTQNAFGHTLLPTCCREMRCRQNSASRKSMPLIDGRRVDLKPLARINLELSAPHRPVHRGSYHRKYQYCWRYFWHRRPDGWL